jgi:hypothetical protein
MVLYLRSITRYDTFYSIVTVSFLFYNITLAGSCMLSNQEIGRCSSKTDVGVRIVFAMIILKDVVCLPEDRVWFMLLSIADVGFIQLVL